MDLHWITLLDIRPFSIAYALSMGAVVHVLLNKKNPRSALAWTATIILLPIVGMILYAVFGISRAESRAVKLMRSAKLKAQNSAQFIDKKPPADAGARLSLSRKFYTMNRIGQTLTGKAVSGGNAVHPLYNGDEAYEAMLQAIEEAEDYVYLETYIFNGGETGAQFVEALARAANRGVDVRLLVDGLGEYYSWSRPWRVLASKGVRVARFLPLRLFPPNFFINLRNHRKVLVADGRGFTGGMNIADYHVQKQASFSVQDVHFYCSGPIVTQLREAFLLDWGFCTNNYTVLPRSEEEMCGDILCRIVLDGPGSGSDPLHELLFAAIAAAKESVCIMTPYFLPTHEVVSALQAAALRGVRVQVILPAKNNIRMVHWASFHLLPALIQSGVRIFFQPPPFAHTKLFIVDEYYTQIGSANFDARSLRLNFELNVECFDSSFTREMRTYFEKIKSASQEYHVEKNQWSNLPKRLRSAACWLFSPYL